GSSKLIAGNRTGNFCAADPLTGIIAPSAAVIGDRECCAPARPGTDTVAILPRNPPSNASFNPKTFLGSAGLGKVLKKYKKNEPIFAQGEIAGTVFYIQKGKVRVTVLSKQGKEAV